MGWSSAESDERRVESGGSVTLDLTVVRQVYDLDAVVATVEGPGKQTRVSGAVGMVGVVPARQIQRTVGANPVDAIRGQEGVDLVDTGVGGRVFTFRGFNNIFSGALRYLVDYRKASLPSLRANFSHFVPTTTADMEQMELVLGPSSAIYGPNS
ncbi:MAG: Plug domain-containing protein, partial [Actinobacteria bacterium]|nr:Plug domain-containing protein [Actinomycetota bacterium]NIU68660.1 Plug domain-containing protein [Actinomycetota bacterium]NIW30506.1 TonB-dependent receptor plug domain-containing protein [Actinomycetota bacterium]